MRDDRVSESLAYYASHGGITDPGPQAAAFAGLPADIRVLTRAVQGLVFHYFAEEKIFGWRPPKDRLALRPRAALLSPMPLSFILPMLFPAVALKDSTLRDIRLEVDYIPLAFKQDAVKLEASLAP
jgi:hypothetical protein